MSAGEWVLLAALSVETGGDGVVGRDSDAPAEPHRPLSKRSPSHI